MKNKIILLSGKKRSGKDTVAIYFLNLGNYVRMAFADRLKEDCVILLKDILNIDPNLIDCYGDKKENSIGVSLRDGTELTNRNFMQLYGYFMRTIFDKDYWVKKVIHNINYLKYTNIVITDVRFPNEIELVKKELGDKYNIITIRIERNTGLFDNDISETSLDNYKFDYILDNNGTLKNLCDALKKVND